MAVLNVIFNEVLKVQCQRSAFKEGNIVYVKCRLKLRVFEQVIQDDVGNAVLLQVDRRIPSRFDSRGVGDPFDFFHYGAAVSIIAPCSCNGISYDDLVLSRGDVTISAFALPESCPPHEALNSGVAINQTARWKVRGSDVHH